MKRETVLIIEDDNDIRGLLTHALTEIEGYKVLAASNGIQGLDQALSRDPDVILLDLLLPDMSGLSVLEALHARELQISVIVITAREETEVVLRAFRLGAKDFLRKPLKMRQLGAAIEAALREKRLRHQKEQLTQELTETNQRLKKRVGATGSP
jgi:two-component system NtrC family sensor kinase